MTATHLRPDFSYLSRTFQPLGHGLHFSAPPPGDITSARYLASQDPWEAMGCILARLQGGAFDTIEDIPRVLGRNDGALIWAGGMQLLGLAAPWSVLRPLAQQLVGERRRPEIQINVPEMLQYAMAPWAVDLLLDIHAAAFAEGRAHLVHSCLSRLIEPVAGLVDAGPERIETPDPDYPPEFGEMIIHHETEAYREAVRLIAAGMFAEQGGGVLAIAEGEIFDLGAMAGRMHERLCREQGRSGRFDLERMVFEATTGIECNAFYSEDWKLDRLAAMAVLEDFLESGKAAEFERGRRYFFGHRVPD